MFGVFGNSQIVEEQDGAGGRHQGFDLDVGLVLDGAVTGDVDVAGPADGGAGLAAGEVVDHGAGEDTHVGAHFGQHVASGFVVCRIGGVGRLADVAQRRGQNFGRRIQIGNATGFELAGVGGIEHQIPGVFWHGRASQRFFNCLFVDGDGHVAPAPRHKVIIAGIDLVQLGHDGGIQIGEVGDLFFVQLAQQARFDLRFGKHRAGHHQVVTRIARYQFGVEHFVVFECLVIDLDAGFFLEIGQQVFGHVVRPVVQIEYLGFSAGIASCAGCLWGAAALFAACRQQQRACCYSQKMFCVHCHTPHIKRRGQTTDNQGPRAKLRGGHPRAAHCKGKGEAWVRRRTDTQQSMRGAWAYLRFTPCTEARTCTDWRRSTTDR